VRVRLGTPSFLRVWFNSRMRPCQGRDNGAIPFTRSIFVWSVAHQQRCLRTATIDMREAERAALSAPTIFEGIAQSAERVRHMHQVEGANPSALTICPCGVVQTTRLPLMQEITGAKPVRDAILIGAWFTGKSRPT
jgi:hypothetical protein